MNSSDLWLRRQSRRGTTHLLVVGTIDGTPISKRIPGADPADPAGALLAAEALVREVRSRGSTRPPQPVARGRWRQLELQALEGVQALLESQQLRPGTAACRARWLRRATVELMAQRRPINQGNLHRWVLQSPQGSRERRERLTAARSLAEAAGFVFAASSQARYSSRGLPAPALRQVLSADDRAALTVFSQLVRADPTTAWAVGMGLATGARLMGVLAMHPGDLAALATSGAAPGDSVRYWDSKRGRRKINRAILSLDLSEHLHLAQVPEEFRLVLMPWNRPATPHEHERARLAAARVHQRLKAECGAQARHLGARWLRHLAALRLLRSGMAPVQVAAAISTSLPRLEERYGALFPHAAPPQT